MVCNPLVITKDPRILGQGGGGGDHPSLVHPGMGCLPILGSSRDAWGETVGNSGIHGHVPASLDNPRSLW